MKDRQFGCLDVGKDFPMGEYRIKWASTRRKYRIRRPFLIGGKDTSTLIDGKSLLSESELSQLGVLKLQECMVLEDSYLRLRYKVDPLINLSL